MKPDENTNHAGDDANNVADQNVRRLLEQAYRPEAPDPQFVERATAAMLAVAQHRARPAVSTQPLWDTKRVAVWAAAAVLLIAGGILLGGMLREGTDRPDRPLLVEAPATVVSPNVYDAADNDRRVANGSVGIDPQGLVAFAPNDPPPPERLTTGGSLETTAGQRRRVTLPDGSILYLNQDTAVTLGGSRHVKLDRGQIFVEVASRHPIAIRRQSKTKFTGAGAPSYAIDRFVVETPDRRLTALGTKFHVRHGDEGTGVTVTQGKVQVSGLKLPLSAGQQLAPWQEDALPAVSAAPRATHVIEWTRDLIAAAKSPLVPASEYAGGALIAIDPNGQEAKLSLRKLHVDVHIEDGFARTTIDQTYFNHMSSRLKGTFYFPLPPDASLSRLAMYVGGKLMEGGMAERKHARETFDAIVRKMQDPALLEWIDGSTFRMEVFPLEGRQEKRIVLSYTQKLPSLYRQTEYRFPAGHSMSIVKDWSAQVRVTGGDKLRFESDSHEFDVDKLGGDLLLKTSQKNVAPDRDVVLTLRERKRDAKDRARVRFGAAQHEQSKYLMLRWRPELPTRQERQRRDWIVLFEAAADRDPVLARAQIDIVRTLLENAEHDDTFAVVTAGTRVHRFAAKPQAASPENVRRAIKFLQRTHLVGALDLGQALDAARSLAEGADNPHLVHVGSATPILGERDADQLLGRIPDDVCYVGVGVGKRWSRSWMKRAAGQTGGYFTQINPDEQITWRAMELLATLNTARLLNVSVVDLAEKHRFLCHNESLADGEELCAIARLEKDAPLPASLEVTGVLDGQTFSERIPIAEVTDGAGYLPRIWAKLEIDRLLATGANQNRSQIIRLSKDMYVMSPFTSLLVLENEQMYKKYKVDRGRKDHWALYPCPEQIDVVHEPITRGMAVNRPAQTESGKPTPAQVLRTIVVPGSRPILYGPSQPVFHDRRYIRISPDRRYIRISPTPMFSGSGEAPAVYLYDGRPQAVRDFDGWNAARFTSGSVWLGDYDGDGRFMHGTAGGSGRGNTWGMGMGGMGMGGMGGGFRSYGFGQADRFGVTRHLYGDGSGRVNQNGIDAQTYYTLGYLNGDVTSSGNGQQPPGGMGGFGGGRYGEFNGRWYRGTQAGVAPGSTVTLMPNGRVLSWNGISTSSWDTPDGGWHYVPRPVGVTVTSGSTFVNGPDLLLALPKIRLADIDVSLGETAQDRSPDGGLVGPVRIEQLEGLDTIVLIGRSRDTERVLEAIAEIEMTAAMAQSASQITLDNNFDFTNMAAPEHRRALFFLNLKESRARRQKAVVDLLYQSELGAMPFPDEGPLPYPTAEVWKKLTAERSQRYNLLSLASLGRRGKAIEDALDSEAKGLDFPVPTALSEVVRTIKENHGIEVQIDTKALEDVGMTSDEEIQKELKGISLRSALRLILREKELTYMIQDEVLLITTPDEANRHLRTTVYPQSPLPEIHAHRTVSRILQREPGSYGKHLTYKLPEFDHDNWNVYSNLLRFAPGMHTNLDDVCAVLEAEAEMGDGPAAGKIDERARELIEKARGRGWRAANVKDDEGKVVLSVRFDGTGRYRCRRVTACGLREQIVSDGASLWHLYPELGLGARRNVGRLQRRYLGRMIPWALPPLEDLARGADLKTIDQYTVAIVPHGVEKLDDKKDKDGKPLKYGLVHLIFGPDDGRLVERRLVEMPSKKTLLRQACAADGTIEWFDADGKVLAERKIDLEPCGAPDLTPDGEKFVIVPLPLRMASLYAWCGGVEYAKASEDNALASVLAGLRVNPEAVRQTLGQRFFNRGDRRLGLYTLLIASGYTWDPAMEQDFGKNVRLEIDPLADHPDAPLAKYIAAYLKLRTDDGQGEFGPLDNASDWLLVQLAEFHDLYAAYKSGKARPDGQATRQEYQDRTIHFLRNCKMPGLGWALLRAAQNHRSVDSFYRVLAETFEDFQHVPGLAYAARYEHARAMHKTGRNDRARETFTKLHTDAVKAGFLPPIDADFRKAFEPNGRQEEWRKLMRDVAKQLVDAGARPAVIQLAWQARQVGDQSLGNELFETARADAGDNEQLATTFAVVEYLYHTGRQAEADAALQPLLDNSVCARWPSLWRLAGRLAEQQGHTARALGYLEQATVLRHERYRKVMPVDVVRNDYRGLLDRYRQLAESLVADDMDPPPQLLGRIVRVADRWRVADPEPQDACRTAAKILSDLGAAELAWDYVTTPLAAKPAEAVSWKELAEELREQAQLDLAARAYASAFRAEPGNPQLLWDRAQVLFQAERSDEAQELLEKIAEGPWQSTHRTLQSKARQRLNER